jgi:hypothetical protein
VDLVPKNGATGVFRNPYLAWRDPAAGPPAQAALSHFLVSQGNVVVGPAIEPATTQPTIGSPGIKWETNLPSGEVNLEVWFTNAAGTGPVSQSNFSVA